MASRRLLTDGELEALALRIALTAVIRRTDISATELQTDLSAFEKLLAVSPEFGSFTPHERQYCEAELATLCSAPPKPRLVG